MAIVGGDRTCDLHPQATGLFEQLDAGDLGHEGGVAVALADVARGDEQVEDVTGR